MCLVAALLATAGRRLARHATRCKAVEVNGGADRVQRNGLLCRNYVAVQDLSVLVDQKSGRLLGVCAPETTTLLDYIRTLVQYANRNPITGKQNAGAFAIAALNEAFPCPDESAANPHRDREKPNSNRNNPIRSALCP